MKHLFFPLDGCTVIKPHTRLTQNILLPVSHEEPQTRTSGRIGGEWICRYGIPRIDWRSIDRLSNTEMTPPSSGTEETPCPPGFFHVGWVRTHAGLNTLTLDDARQTCHCKPPSCVCPQNGPDLCESTCGNGRCKLTNSLVVNIPKKTTVTTGASSGSVRERRPLRKDTVVSCHLDFLVLLYQTQSCHLLGASRTPSESHEPPVKFQKVEHKVPELRQNNCPRTCPPACQLPRTDSPSEKP